MKLKVRLYPQHFKAYYFHGTYVIIILASYEIIQLYENALRVDSTFFPGHCFIV